MAQLTININGLSRRQLIAGAVGLTASLASAVLVIIAIRPHLTPRGSAFTNAQLAQITGFKPYYLKPGTSTDFGINKSTISYQHDVLVFSLKNPAGKSLAFSEQHISPNFEQAGLQTTKQFSTEYGAAYITDTANRTTGALFSHDNTLVIINAPSPIGVDAMQQLLSGLAPIKQPN